MKFKPFTLEKLFTASKGDTDLQKRDINGKGQFVVTSGETNQGIEGRTDRPAKIFPSNTITIDFLGNVYYREYEYKMVTHNRVCSLSGNVIRNDKVGIYLVGVLSKLRTLFSYNHAATWDRLKILTIELPVTSTNDIDYEYMQERITELEQERITELDAYLAVSGLNDYELTEEDKKLLYLSTTKASDETNALGINGKNEEITFSTFKIEEIFEVVEAGYKYKKKDFNKKRDVSPNPTEEYSLPLVNAKFGNNGIMYYGRKSDWNAQEMCIDIIQDGAVAAGTVYAQPESVGVLYNAYLIKPVEEIKSAEALLYMAECVEKSIKKQFSYDKKATWDRVKKCEISLPVTKEGNINFHYMEGYIRAVEKLAIADVVKYKDKVIDTTKRLVEAGIGR